MPSKPELFIAAGIFHPEAGGPATYLHDILPALQKVGWSIRVLAYGDAPTTNYPYPLIRVPRRTLPIRLFNYWRHARNEVQHADLIYAHTLDLPVTWGSAPRVVKIVGDTAWERSIRRGWVAPTTDIDTFQFADVGLLARQQRASRSRQVQEFDGVIVPSHYLKQMVCGWGVDENKVHVIYNALPPMPDDMPASQQAARQLLGWDDRPTIFTAARLNPWKGIDHIIKALEAVPDVRLVVAGDGPDKARLVMLAQSLGERVQFTGYAPREQVYLMMQAADYYTLYSGYEGLPHTALEALRVGTPVIASDKGGNPEVVRHEANGLLVPYIDVEALTATFQRAFGGDMCARLSAQTKDGLEQFTFEYMVKQTDTILRQYL